MFAVENRKDSEELEALTCIQNQVKELRLQDNLGKQNFHENMKKVFVPVAKSIKDVAEEKL